MRTSILLALVTVTGCAVDSKPLPLPDDAQPVTVQPVSQAEQSYTGFDTELRKVIRDDVAWTAAWKRLNQDLQPLPAQPAIDFTQQTVVLAALGTRNSGGFTIDIVEAQTKDDADWFTIRESTPGSGCVVTDALTAPVAVATVPRFAGTATFIDLDPVARDCE